VGSTVGGVGIAVHGDIIARCCSGRLVKRTRCTRRVRFVNATRHVEIASSVRRRAVLTFFYCTWSTRHVTVTVTMTVTVTIGTHPIGVLVRQHMAPADIVLVACAAREASRQIPSAYSRMIPGRARSLTAVAVAVAVVEIHRRIVMRVRHASGAQACWVVDAGAWLRRHAVAVCVVEA
jgi:hypothetical protein